MKANAVLFGLIGIVLSLCSNSQDSNTAGHNPASDTLPENILIINSFDAMSIKARKNKKELFAELVDSLKQLLYNRIDPQYKPQAIIIPGVLPETANSDSSIFSLMAANNASYAIVIKKLNVFFNQTGVEVVKEKDNNKTRTASYDICAVVTYSQYDGEEKLAESEISICEFYTTRGVASGLLAAGPDVVGKSKDAFKIIAKNADKLILSDDQPIFARIHNKRNRKIIPSDTLLKYSLSFADQAQMAYDGLKLKTRFSEVWSMEPGDIAYYNGKYFNSRVRYWYALETVPRPSGMYDLRSMHGVDTGYLNNQDIKYYTRLTSTIGMLYQTRGKFVQASELLTRAMELRASRFGKTSPEYINSLHNMAVLKKDMGLYDEADSLFNYLVPVFEKLFTTNSLQYVVLLNNKAMLLAELGRTKEAIQLLDEALGKGATVLSSSYFDYERILTNRALLEQESGNLDKAEKDYLQVLDNMEKKGFDDHPDYNNVMVYYGSLRVQKNDPEVLGFLLRVADKVKKRYSENHPLMAKALTNMGDYYLNKNSYAEARDIYNEVASIQLKALGEKHKDYLNTLIKTAVCEWRLRDIDNATTHFNKAIRNYLSLADAFFLSISESEKSIFWRTLKPNIDTYFSFAIETGLANPALLKEAYDLQLKTKGILINSTKKTKNIILNSADSVTRRLYSEWLNLKSTLSIYYSSPLEDLKEDKVDLTALEEQANEAEKELSRRSSRFNSAYRPVAISFDDIRAKLNPEEIAVEIIRVFHYYGDHKGESEYIALVVKKDALNPILVRIGNGNDLERKYLSDYKRCIKNKTTDANSYTNYWQPLASIVGSHKTIYISVDGVYNSINLNTLMRDDGTFILDNYNIVLVPNTRSVVSDLKSLSLPGNKSEAILVGSPVYGNDIVIPPLPGTKEEIQRIDTILLRNHVKAEVFIEQNASEQNIKAVSRPLLLHIATHGFFNANVDLSKNMNIGIQVSKAKDNPLLRSGLLLNGAASVYTDAPILDRNNNGILHAYEAMNLDLEGTKLVVLSACETGMGEIVNGEGVYGLSRSFQVAGAGKILMSLWKVDDQATRQLMIAFYENWVKLNNPQQALLQAQKMIKKKFPSPYYWGAFVLLN
jgi:CHAT domain-containing protein/tetratricopeptide (TPR) repeat protein